MFDSLEEEERDILDMISTVMHCQEDNSVLMTLKSGRIVSMLLDGENVHYSWVGGSLTEDENKEVLDFFSTLESPKKGA